MPQVEVIIRYNCEDQVEHVRNSIGQIGYAATKDKRDEVIEYVENTIKMAFEEGRKHERGGNKGTG